MIPEPDRLFPGEVQFTTRTDGTCDIGDCPGCQCHAVRMAPCNHCENHWFDMESS